MMYYCYVLSVQAFESNFVLCIALADKNWISRRHLETSQLPALSCYPTHACANAIRPTSISDASCSPSREEGTGEVARELERELGREFDPEHVLELSCDVAPGCEAWFIGRRPPEVGRDVGRDFGVSSFVILVRGAKIPI